ncbi:MAG: twin arginine-targeting protein translocase TatC [Deltaproteobacteria bacterium RBG_16_47_11]|nr:MAG: twin arginine-targeting protein translocase TatC [Deltaproteobacteria bacterium RBG_16_47_11]
MKREEIFQALSTLRKGLLQIVIVILLSGIIVFPISKELLAYLCQRTLETDLVAYSIPEAFFSLLKLSLYTSLFCSIPIIFYHIWKAFSPLFRSKGLSSANGILFTSIFLFYLGAFFCFFVALPNGVKFLLGYQSAHIKPMISAGKYVSFCAVFIFGFGLTFELPLILALLSYLRVVNASFLTRNRKYAILLTALTAAVVTPTPDVFNMSLMGVPMYLLFEIGVILVKVIERKRASVQISLSPK